MPNHFLTVGLCGRDWSRADDDGNHPPLESLVDANLCRLIAPLPSELEGITSPGCERYVHKETGEVHKGDALFPDATLWERVRLTSKEHFDLLDKYGAVNWYDWQSDNWGTKWGTYGTKVHELGGDGRPVLVEFQSAWGPPSPEMMARINDYLSANYGLVNILWIGHDPFDDSTAPIEVAESLVRK